MKNIRYSTFVTIVGLLVSISGHAADTSSLQGLLDRTGKSVDQFFRQFPSVACSEVVKREKLGSGAKILFQQQSSYDYMIFMDFHGDALSVEESRLEQSKPGKHEKSKELPLLISNGFSTLALIFHPIYQGNFEFERLEDADLGGRKSARVHFRHLPGTRSTAALRLSGTDYPLELEGTAWIDPESGEIREITAQLVTPMKDLNLQLLTSDVKYEAVHFNSASEEFWLPSEASVYVETPYQRWRNLHRFTGYRLFSVNTESTISTKK